MDESELEIQSTALLDADKIDNANQSLHCFSCGEDMSGLFCAACGNKNDNFRRSIWSLAAELFASLTALEGRIWRSLRSLFFRPGRMAREFADGARQKWTTPIRMYLAASILLFGYIALTQTQLIAFGPAGGNEVRAADNGQILAPRVFLMERRSQIKKMVPEAEITRMQKNLESVVDGDMDRPRAALERELTVIDESLASIDQQIGKSPAGFVRKQLEQTRASFLARKTKLQSAVQGAQQEPAASTDSEAGDDKSESEDYSGGNTLTFSSPSGESSFTLDAQGMQTAAAIALREPERVNSAVNKYVSQIMFFMMPLSMVLGALFIRGREKAMLYDHLVHAAYIHAFAFFLLLLFIILVQFTPIGGLPWVYLLIMAIYLPISAKNMFGRSWPKTIIASYGVGLIYTMNMAVILTGLLIWGVLDIAADVARSAG